MAAVVNAKGAVERLLAAGCPFDELVLILGALARSAAPQPPRRTRARAARLEPRIKEDLKLLEQQLWQVAHGIARFGDNADVWLMVPSSKSFARGLIAFYKDVAFLRRLAGNRPLENALLAWLVHVVHSHTGKWHDTEIAFLVAAARGQDYDRTTHAKWRMRHQKLIARGGAISAEHAMSALIREANSQRLELTRSSQEEGVVQVGSNDALTGGSTGRVSRPSNQG